MTSLKLKVLTLNCWAIPTELISKHKNKRIEAISEEIGKGEYDIVLLQEIWSQCDYQKLCEKVVNVLPHTHYWYSGMFGSGVCVFSKYCILETFQHNYTLNGYAQRVFHGDWFGGKCVGLAKIGTKDFRINVYATHTHASYSNNDGYDAHRIAQAYELSQFIRFTSEACDVCIVGGDFNFKPTDLGYHMIKYNANLEDAWLTQKEKKGHGITVNAKSNSFAKPNHGEHCIDFIMYKSNSGNLVSCDECCTTMSKIPGTSYNYSDHEGVVAKLTLQRIVTAMATPREAGEVEKHFTNAVQVLDTGMKRVKANQMSQAIAFLLCTTLLLFSSEFYLPFGINFLLKCFRAGLVLVSAYSFWSAIVLANKELNGLLSVRKDINNLLKSNPPGSNR